MHHEQTSDECRDLYQWALRNRAELPPPFRLTSLPLDAAATDFGERLNRYSHQNLSEPPLCHSARENQPLIGASKPASV